MKELKSLEMFTVFPIVDGNMIHMGRPVTW